MGPYGGSHDVPKTESGIKWWQLQLRDMPNRSHWSVFFLVIYSPLVLGNSKKA